MIKEKKCSKCKQNLPATLDFFHKQSDRKSGLTSHCKQCRKEYADRYRIENKDKIAKCNQKYQKKNRNKLNQYQYRRYHNGLKYLKKYKNGKLIQKSHFIMEQFLERILTPDEVIHHIDGNPLNDKLANLYLCKNQGEHLAIHRGELLLSR